MKAKASIWLTHPNGFDSADYYSIYQGAMETQGWYKVKDIEVEFTPPTREEVIPSAVAALREAQTKIRAEAEKRSVQIEEQIRNLLCLTNEVKPLDLGADDDIPF